MLRWTTRSLLYVTAGCSIPLATWVMLGRPDSLLAMAAAACLFFGPAIYGTSTPTPRSWRRTGHDLTEQQPLFMGIGILMIAFGILLAFALFLRATVPTYHARPWWLLLGALTLSGGSLIFAGSAVGRFQTVQLRRRVAKTSQGDRSSPKLHVSPRDDESGIVE